MPVRVRQLVLPWVFMVLLGAAAMDEGAREVADTIEQLRAALRTLRDSSQPVDPAQVIAAVRTTVLPRIDADTAGRLVMGHHWRAASAAQRAAFIDACRELLLRLYGGQAMDYVDAKVEFMASQPAPDGERLRVRTRVQRPGKPDLQVDYPMRRNQGRWQAFDVVVNGVSAVITLRQSVGEDLARYGIDGVIERLRAKLEEAAAPRTD